MKWGMESDKVAVAVGGDKKLTEAPAENQRRESKEAARVHPRRVGWIGLHSLVLQRTYVTPNETRFEFWPTPECLIPDRHSCRVL